MVDLFLDILAKFPYIRRQKTDVPIDRATRFKIHSLELGVLLGTNRKARLDRDAFRNGFVRLQLQVFSDLSLETETNHLSSPRTSLLV
mmetsp:Transcript_65741/g.148345  ORF Transcript_65741/g.148345 Transcript_65741/m.148345 type:complete len:88 (+) Transcript_65741:926-1189(+)